ncbi:MAG: Rpn family recombination-promoting nuclease/putative transposase [Eubacteriales bacterium]|nr:Rpn family recombination-promoting nuclease/putative transposase [Eubacteriales bacterium]
MDRLAELTPDKEVQSTKEKFDRVRQEGEREIPYGLTNDYMFRAVFQKNPTALKGLIAAALGRSPEEITSCEIQNPIVLGESIDAKTCILDIQTCINGREKINVEMQMGNLGNWPKRALYYTCSMYTDLKAGSDYHHVLPCIHIGFVSRSPFPDNERFFSRYLLAEEGGHVFTEDFALVMINLGRIPEGLTGEGDSQELWRWARLLCAKSWKEAVDMSEQSAGMREAVVTMHEMSQEETIRNQCLARILYQGDMNSARQDGYQEGHQEGCKDGMRRVNRLNAHLIAAGRLEDLVRASEDLQYQEALLEELGL